MEPPPIRAAREMLLAHGITPDRYEILQNASTLVLRLTPTLVARVVQDIEGPRQGTEWFARENAVAQHLTTLGAPVIPLHPDLPPGPHEHLGYPMNFWKFVTATGAEPHPEKIGETLGQCHGILRRFEGALPRLAILTESLGVVDTLGQRNLLPADMRDLLRRHLNNTLEALAPVPGQPLHGDAHPGNLLNTTEGLLWTDWEDTFSGPPEWDLASVLWNARFLEKDDDAVGRILAGYRNSGGSVDNTVLEHCFVARAAVMCAWYPVLYPEPNADRRAKLAQRLEWLRGRPL
jgi:hypothetical protein